MEPVDIERSLQNALASSAMEGFSTDSAVIRDCRRLIRGEVDVAALAAQITRKKKI